MNDVIKYKSTSLLSQGYGVIPKLVMKDKEISAESKAIYAYMCSYAGSGQSAFPGVELMLCDLNLSVNRFYKHRKQLIDKGYITIQKQRKANRRDNNLYIINIDIFEHRCFEDLQNEDLQFEDLQNEGTNNNSINNNSINNNSIKNLFVEDSKEFQLAELLYSKILKNNIKFKKPNMQTWCKEFDKILRIDNRDINELKKVIVWCQQDSFWCTNILSPMKLRKQYDQLVIKMVREGNKDGNIKGYTNRNTKYSSEDQQTTSNSTINITNSKYGQVTDEELRESGLI